MKFLEHKVKIIQEKYSTLEDKYEDSEKMIDKFCMRCDVLEEVGQEAGWVVGENDDEEIDEPQERMPPTGGQTPEVERFQQVFIDGIQSPFWDGIRDE